MTKRNRWCWAALGAGIVAGLGALRANEPATKAGPEWKLVWSDEFDGKEIDKAKWDFDTGNGFYSRDAKTWIGGWGNDELQYYTSERQNAFIQDGALHIRAIKESNHGFEYTSARLKTRKGDGSPLFNKTYGKFEFRAKLPTGQGIWPALWMLPQDEKYGGWAHSGEIDVMEARGQEPTKVLGTLHYGGGWPTNTHEGKDYVLPRKANHRRLSCLHARMGAGRDPLVRRRRALPDAVVLVERKKSRRWQGPGANRRERPQPLAGSVRPAVLPRHECRRGRQVSR